MGRPLLAKNEWMLSNGSSDNYLEPQPWGGFLKIIPIDIPTYASMKSGF